MLCRTLSRRYASVPGLNSPLQCIVEYHGFRVFAIAELQFVKDTPDYGSEDGGATVCDGDAEVKEKMKVNHLSSLKRLVFCKIAEIDLSICT
jgi:hypothetical protein